MFIKLTLSSTNEIFYFNIDYIVGFGKEIFSKEDSTTIDVLGDTYMVKESPEEILKLIKECEK